MSIKEIKLNTFYKSNSGIIYKIINKEQLYYSDGSTKGMNIHYEYYQYSRIGLFMEKSSISCLSDEQFCSAKRINLYSRERLKSK